MRVHLSISLHKTAEIAPSATNSVKTPIGGSAWCLDINIATASRAHVIVVATKPAYAASQALKPPYFKACRAKYTPDINAAGPPNT